MKHETELSKIEPIARSEELRTEIDKLRPLSTDVENRIFQKFRLDWNYHSNAIEGNTLNYGETYAFLMHGVTAKGKPLKDYLDIKGHNNAINFLLNFIHDKDELTEVAIRELHKIILSEPYEIDAVTLNGKMTKKKVELGVYKKNPNHVRTATGEIHYFATPEETPAKMHDLMKWYREAKANKEIHSVVLASFLHHKFASIHPFDDGNGRIARILMNLILMQDHLPPAIIKKEDRGNYYLALSQADVGNYLPFVEYVAEAVIHSQEIYLRGTRGESIEEPDDVDKKIHLLVKEIDSQNKTVTEIKSLETIKEITDGPYGFIIKYLDSKLRMFEKYFLDYKINLYCYKREASYGMGNIENVETGIASLADSISNEVTKISSIIELQKFKSLKNSYSINVLFEIIFDDFSYQINYEVFEITEKGKKPYADKEKIAYNNRPILYKNEIDNGTLTKIASTIVEQIIELFKKNSTDIELINER